MGMDRVIEDGEGNAVSAGGRNTLYCATKDPANRHEIKLEAETIEQLRQSLRGTDPDAKEAAKEQIGEMCAPPMIAALPEPDKGRSA